MRFFVAAVLAVEAYYWLWWLPRNWRGNQEARTLHWFLFERKGTRG